MIRHLFLLFSLIILQILQARSQGPERGIILPISEKNASDLAFGYDGTTYLTVNYDHLFYLKPKRFAPAVLLRAGLGHGFAPGYGVIVATEAAYTTGYLTFAEVGAGYHGRINGGRWQNLPYFLAAFRYRSNRGISIRLFSRLIMHQSEEVPLFGLGLSLGFTF